MDQVSAQNRRHRGTGTSAQETLRLRGWRSRYGALAMLLRVCLGLLAGRGMAAPFVENTPGLLSHFKWDGDGLDSLNPANRCELENTLFVDGALFLNGGYRSFGSGAGFTAIARVPDLDVNSFTIGVDFHLRKPGVILYCGDLGRMLGVECGFDGSLTITLNNGALAFRVEETVVETGRWHSLACSVDVGGRSLRVMLDGVVKPALILPEGFQFNSTGQWWEKDSRNFTFTDYSQGRPADGFVDDLMVVGRAMDAGALQRFSGQPAFPKFLPGVYADNRPGQPQSPPAGSNAPLEYSPFEFIQNGSVVDGGDTYAGAEFFPYLILQNAAGTVSEDQFVRWLTILHPGKGGKAASLTWAAGESGVHTVAGQFARANDFPGAGDGVVVMIFKNSDTEHPLFTATLGPESPGNPYEPFAGPATASFSLKVPLEAGDALRWVVFGGERSDDIDFDATALRVVLVRREPPVPEIPDLKVTSMRVEPDGPHRLGERVRLVRTIRNASATPMNAAGIEVIRLSGLSLPDELRREWTVPIEPLGAGVDVERTMELRIPNDSRYRGNLYFHEQVYPPGVDLAGGDNDHFSAVFEILQPTELAELSVEMRGLQPAPGDGVSPVAGPPLELGWTVRNRGTAAAVDVLQEILLTDGTRTGVVERVVSAGSIDPGDHRDWGRIVTFPSGWNGTVRLGVRLDPDLDVAESEEVAGHVAWTEPFQLKGALRVVSAVPSEVREDAANPDFSIRIERTGVPPSWGRIGGRRNGLMWMAEGGPGRARWTRRSEGRELDWPGRHLSASCDSWA